MERFIDKKVFVRTVTNYFTGLLVAVTDQSLILEQAAWVADTGRFSAGLADGTLSEVEPYPDGPVLVARGAVIDLCEWRHELPRDVR